MTSKPYMTMLEVISLILTEHPDGMTLSEIQDSPLWARVDGSWKKGIHIAIFGHGPSILQLVQTLVPGSSTRAGSEPVAQSSNSFMPSQGRWTPTPAAERIADSVRPKLPDGSL
jgi:hypothetical protein